jgi:hypothetical protein
MKLDEPGTWMPTVVKIEGVREIASSWERQLREIEALIKAAPVFKDIRGYYPRIILEAAPPAGGRGPWLGHVAVEPWWWVSIERSPGGEPVVKRRWIDNGPGGLWMNVNSRGDLSHWAWWEDKEGRFCLLPEQPREIAGFPVTGDRLFITAAGRPPLWDPLPLERALRWVIGDLRRQAKADQDGLAASRRAYEQFVSPAGLEKRHREIEAAAASQKKPENQAIERRQAEAKDRRREQDLRDAASPKAGSPEAATGERLAALEARLAGLAAADRAQPAWLRTEPNVRGAAGELVPPDTRGARPLVVPSPFFDPKLPADALQLVTVTFRDFEDRVKAGAREPQSRVPLAVAEQTDWRAVQKLLR